MEVVKSAAQTLFDSNIKDISMEYLEVGIDSIIENDLLKELPIVKTVHSVVKVSMAIKEKFFLKKFLAFIKEFNSGSVEEKEIDMRKNAIQNNEQWIYKEIEYLVIYIENLDSIEKARVLAVLYCNYISKKINWERYSQYTEIVNRMFSYDINMLKVFYRYNQTIKNDESKGFFYDLTSYNRLIGLGLMEKEIDIGQDTSKYGNVFVDNSYFYRITYSGKFIGNIINGLM